LVGNAIKYTDRGAVMVRVEAAGQGGSATMLRFEVADTGAGIPDDRREYIFEPFTQLSESRKQGGTGLGLSICKQLVEKMGGTIGVREAPAGGSIFWFELRLEATDNDAGSESRRGLAGVRALVVDDNAVNREILRHQLGALGVALDAAESGPRALDKLHAAAAAGRPFDIVVLDDHMPGMNGVELARGIRADATVGSPPLVMLSSTEMDEDRALEAGVGYFLTRPVRQSHLYDCLVSAMRGKVAAGPVEPQGAAHARLYARVLLVEDNPVNQELARHMLEFLGCTCVVAGDGHEALAAVGAGEPFDVVLMDCEMPGMDGFEATAAIRLREAEGMLRQPIVALTAGAIEGVDREKCLAAGMDDYLSKPFSLPQLEQALRRWITVPPGGNEPHVDLAVIERLLEQAGGGSDLLRSLIRTYLADAPTRVAAIREGMLRGDGPAVARAAHALKSASANLGAVTLAQLCKELERHCRSGHTDEADELARSIGREFEHVREELAERSRAPAA
ncbi:MAG TPA: response regulator, partial [Usitatibacter sp.]|nr:response regulator [Usitatibacter sp.]